MIKMWDHVAVVVKPRAKQETLDEYSRDGWELVAVSQGYTKMGIIDNSSTLWFKREKSD